MSRRAKNAPAASLAAAASSSNSRLTAASSSSSAAESKSKSKSNSKSNGNKRKAETSDVDARPLAPSLRSIVPAASSSSSSSSNASLPTEQGRVLLTLAAEIQKTHFVVVTESSASSSNKGQRKGKKVNATKSTSAPSSSDSSAAASLLTSPETTFLECLRSSPQADPTATDKNGDTFLHHVFRFRTDARYDTQFEYSIFPYRVLELLLSRSHAAMLKKIDPYAKNKAGQSVLELLRMLVHEAYELKESAARKKADQDEHGGPIEPDWEVDWAEWLHILADETVPADWHAIARRFKQCWQQSQVVEMLDEFLPHDLSKMVTDFITEGAPSDIHSPNVFTFDDALKHSLQGTQMKLVSQVRTWRFPMRQWRVDWEPDEDDDAAYPPDSTFYSPEFEVGGRWWNMILHPNGSSYASEKNGVAVFLQLREPRGSEKVPVRMAVQMLHPKKPEKSKWQLSERDYEPYEFSAERSNWGVKEVISPSEVDDYIFPDGTAVLRVWIEKFFNPPYDEDDHENNEQPESNMEQDSDPDYQDGEEDSSTGEDSEEHDNEAEEDDEMRYDSAEEDEAAQEVIELAAEKAKYGNMEYNKLVRLLGPPTPWSTSEELFDVEEHDVEVTDTREKDVFGWVRL